MKLFLRQGDCMKMMAASKKSSVSAVLCDPPYGLEFISELESKSRNLMNPTSEADIKRKENYGNTYAGRASNLPDYMSFSKYRKEVQKWHREWSAGCYEVLEEKGILKAFNSSKTSHRMIAAFVDEGFSVSLDFWMYLSGLPKARDLGAGVGWYTNLKPCYEPVVVCHKGEKMNSEDKYHMIYVGRKPLSERNIAENTLKHGTGAMNIDACRIATPDGEPAYNYPNGAGGVYSHEYQQNSQVADDWNNFSTVEDNVPVTANELGRWPANSIFSEFCAGIISKQIGAEASKYFFIVPDQKKTNDLYTDKPKENTMAIPQELVDYLHTMITPTHVGGKSLVILEDLNNHDFDQYEDGQWHGCIAVGTPTKEVSEQLMRVVKAGAHLMLVAPEDEPTGYKGACQIEDTGFEIRDSIFFARETDPENPNFMYMPKASRSERELGTEKLDKVSGAEAVDRKEGSAGMENPRAGAGRTANEIGNFHPTVKPIGIMEWLARDVEKGATVLDPFMGSGTMGIACVKTGHSYIGMEIDPEYFPIADARVRHWNESYNAWNSGEIISDLEEESSEESTEDAPTIGLGAFLGL